MAEIKSKQWFLKGIDGVVRLHGDKKILIQGWARWGLTDADIAKEMGIAKKTLYEWQKKCPEIRAEMQKGKQVVDFAVENALLKKALSGDTGACIFWLKNRQKYHWTDNPTIEGQGESGGDFRKVVEYVYDTNKQQAATLHEDV